MCIFNQNILTKMYSQCHNSKNYPHKVVNIFAHILHIGRHIVNKYMKRCVNHQSSGKSKLKLQCEISIHLLKWIKFKRITISCVGNDLNQLECTILLLGTQNGRTTLEKSLKISLKISHTYNPEIVLLDVQTRTMKYFSPDHENICQLNELHKTIYSGYIHNYHKLDTTEMYSKQ